jgi:large conductance mechanosensitive channel
MLKDFKDFALRGNVVDLAVGVIIGAAVGKIVTSLVTDVMMPPIGLLIGGVDFSKLGITLRGESLETLDAAKKAGAVTINYGVFLNTIVQFAVVAFATFMIVRWASKLHKTAAPPPAAATKTETLLEEIRDLLKKEKSS